MAVARQRHDRSLIAAHAKLIGSLFQESDIDMRAFIQRGDLSAASARRLPYMPAVELKIQEIIANGGKLIIPTEAK